MVLVSNSSSLKGIYNEELKDMKYKILFIDEESEQHDYFLDYMESIEDRVEVKCLFPKEDMNQMLEVIEDERPDAIVSDFQLNEIKTEVKNTISYNGSELVNAYREMRPNFPCFVMTSYDDQAVNHADDVNLIYVKNILHRGQGSNVVAEIEVSFRDKILIQICKYKKSIDKAQIDLTILVEKKQKEGLSLNEEFRMGELDSFLEKSLDTHTALPDDVKQSKSLDRLSEAIDKVDEILIKLKVL